MRDKCEVLTMITKNLTIMRHQSQKDISVRFIAIIFFSSVVAFSCNSQPSQENKVVKQDTIKPAGLSDAELAGSFSSQTLLHFDSTSLPAFTKQYPRLKPFEQRMK